jgi:hypothetical protein
MGKYVIESLAFDYDDKEEKDILSASVFSQLENDDVLMNIDMNEQFEKNKDIFSGSNLKPKTEYTLENESDKEEIDNAISEIRARRNKKADISPEEAQRLEQDIISSSLRFQLENAEKLENIDPNEQLKRNEAVLLYLESKSKPKPESESEPEPQPRRYRPQPTLEGKSYFEYSKNFSGSNTRTKQKLKFELLKKGTDSLDAQQIHGLSSDFKNFINTLTVETTSKNKESKTVSFIRVNKKNRKNKESKTVSFIDNKENRKNNTISFK